MDRLTTRVLETIRREDLIPQGSRIAVGFSGGADSVCLLSVLAGLRQLLKADLTAVHVNHGIRGEEADRDEAFCREFCEAGNIPFQSIFVDVPALAREKGLSTEEAARILRYEALEKAAGENGLIAVAHHGDDQAETILFQLLRGSGLKGLSGMQYRRDRIIRPLLDLSGKEIRAWVSERELPFVTDSTNMDDDYARNRIRNVILPELEKINEKAALHLQEAGKKAAQAEELLEAEAAEFVRLEVRIDKEAGEARIPRKKLKDEPQIRRRYVIIETIRRLGIPLKDWGETHFAAVDGILGASTGLHLDLPGGVCADNTAQLTIIGRGTEKCRITPSEH